MKTETFHLELITPCFCAGADQSRAEIRVPSIRGQLRWWFRALGGSSSDEATVFGSAAGDSGRASSLQLRTVVTASGQPWNPPRVDPNDPKSYVFYFASVSGKQKGQKGPGPRWTPQGNIPPGTRMELRVRWLRQLPTPVQEKAETALRIWLCLGGIGTRVTRGLGAFECEELRLNQETLEFLGATLNAAGFQFLVWKRNIPSWTKAISEAGRVLKDRLRSKLPAGKEGNRQSSLGSSKPRQTSALYLRPVRFPDESYGLVIYEAPANRVLGPASRKGAPAMSVLQGA